MWREQRKEQKEFEIEMKRRFPKLYAGLGIGWRNGGMLGGIAVCKGWFPIICDLSEKIEKILNELNSDIRAEQIKEKFAGLAFYTNHYNKEINDLIKEAVKNSYKTCEWCGAEGFLSDNYHWWKKTLCKDCHEKRKQKIKDESRD